MATCRTSVTRTLSWLAMGWLSLAGCAPKNTTQAATSSLPRLYNDADDIPDWQSPEGRRKVWLDLGQWYADNGLANDAMEMVRRLRADGVSGPDVDVIQARALAADGLPEEARRMLEQVVQHHPKRHDAWHALGVVYVDLLRPEDARAALSRAVDLDPTDGKTLNNYGFVLMSTGACPEAVDPLERAVAEDGTNARYRANLAFALVCAGEPKRALDLLRSAMPEAEARYNLGVAYENLDKAPAAVLQYEQALDVDPEHEMAAQALDRLAALTPDPEPGARP